MTIASTSTIVAMVSRCMVARCWAMGTTSTVCASPRANTRRASRSAPPGVVRSPTPTASTPGCQQQHVAALEVLQAGAVELLHPGEARVVGVDGGGDRALAVPGRHGQRGDRDLVADPHRGVAGEQQVGQRGDDEVRAVHHLVGQARAAAQLVVGQPGDERGGQVLGREPGEVAGRGALQAGAQPRVVDGGADQLRPRRRGRRAISVSSAVEVEHLDAAGAQRLGERVVLLLRAVHPGTPSKSSWSLLRGVSRGSSLPGRCCCTGPAPSCAADPAQQRLAALRRHPWVGRAQEEHDAFAEALRERGVEVLYLDRCWPRC